MRPLFHHHRQRRSCETPISSALLVGHSKPLSSIGFNPITTSLLVTTSDDCMVALWSLPSNGGGTGGGSDSNSELPLVMSKSGATPLQLVPMRWLSGHGNRTRAVAWCSASPYLLLTGSWDSTIRVGMFVKARRAESAACQQQHLHQRVYLGISPLRQ